LHEEVLNPDGFAGFQSQNEVLSVFRVRLHVLRLIWKLNNTRFIQRDNASDIFQIYHPAGSICLAYQFCSHD